MSGRGKQSRGGTRGGGKQQGRSGGENVVNTAVAEATEDTGNHGEVSSEEEDPGTHGVSSGDHGGPSGHVSPASTRSGRTRKHPTPSRQDTRSTTTSGNSVASTTHLTTWCWRAPGLPLPHR